MRIILLGSTGYLGGRLIQRFVPQGHTLLCAGRDPRRLAELAQRFPQIQTCPLSQLDAVLAGQAPFDCMVNTICQYARGASSELAIFQANLFVPLENFLICLRHGVHRFITIGTGLPADFNAYSLSKAQLAQLLHWYARQQRAKESPIQVCNVQLESFYGPDEPADRFLPGAVQQLKRHEPVLLTQGTQKRDFIHIDDVTAALEVLLGASLPDYTDLPLGTGEAVPVRQVMEYLKALLGSASELRFGAVPLRRNEPDSVADLTKMRHYGIPAPRCWRDGLTCFCEECGTK